MGQVIFRQRPAWHNWSMCGRYARFTTRERFADLAGLRQDGLPVGETVPSWNVAPGRACTLVRAQLGQAPEMVNLLWGLVPYWAKELPAGRPINARIESAGEKPMFRRLFRYRRCLVAADGWYEWRSEGGAKQPYFIRRADAQPFFFGALWDVWTGAAEPLPTFAILTTEASPELAAIHDRQPVIVRPETYAAWLDKTMIDPAAVRALVPPPEPGELVAYPVSPNVNRPGRDGPELIAPATTTHEPARPGVSD